MVSGHYGAGESFMNLAVGCRRYLLFARAAITSGWASVIFGQIEILNTGWWQDTLRVCVSEQLVHSR